MSGKVQELLTAAAGELRVAGVPKPGYDALKLFEFVLGRRLLSYPVADSDLNDDLRRRYGQAIRMRANRMPVSHIVCQREFYGRGFRVNGDVLDPRPETETLIDLALELGFSRVLDLGTGSGCILITLLAEKTDASGTGIDISERAIGVAETNVHRLGVEARCELLTSDWFDQLGCEKYDLIISNPPYIGVDEYATLAPEVRNYEPRHSLTLGRTGEQAYKQIACRASTYLQPEGWLVLEIGIGQAAKVGEVLASHGFAVLRVAMDLDNKVRALAAKFVRTASGRTSSWGSIGRPMEPCP